MADKYSERVKAVKGDYGIDEWMKLHVVNKPGFQKGFKITCKNLDGTESKVHVNQVGILFENCEFMRQGTDSNHGFGGSNCSTGNPVWFVDIKTVHPAAFAGSTTGILKHCVKPCFVLPLAM